METNKAPAFSLILGGKNTDAEPATACPDCGRACSEWFYFQDKRVCGVCIGPLAYPVTDAPKPEPVPAPTVEYDTDVKATCKRIAAALKARSGKSWSVTHGRGTAYGWITINTLPARRTWGHRLKEGATDTRPENYEGYDMGKPGGSITPTEGAELAALLGLSRPVYSDESIPASTNHRIEYIDRAEGRKPSRIGEQYWD